MSAGVETDSSGSTWMDRLGDVLERLFAQVFEREGYLDGQGQADKLSSVLRAGFFQDPFDVCADSFTGQILGIGDVAGSQALGNQPAGRRPSPLRATA